MTTVPTTQPIPTPDADRRSRIRHRARRPLLLATAALVLAPVLAACSQSGAPTESSTSASSGSTSSSTINAQLGSCLRDAGFDVDDADLHEGRVVAPPHGVDPDAYVSALESCREDLPLGQGGVEAPSAADLAALQAANLEVARCMREKGFEDFPDPVDGDFPMGTTMTPTGGELRPQDEAFFACDAEFGVNGAEAGEGR
jgi:hypothetical protein